MTKVERLQNDNSVLGEKNDLLKETREEMVEIHHTKGTAHSPPFQLDRDIMPKMLL